MKLYHVCSRSPGHHSGRGCSATMSDMGVDNLVPTHRQRRCEQVSEELNDAILDVVVARNFDT
eukprot:5265102-Amphidinium_carterae.1